MTGKRDNPELRLHITILHYLLAVLPLEAADTLIHIPNGEKRTPATGALLKRMGVRRGVEDLQFIYETSVYAVEVKPKGEYQSRFQKDRQRTVVRAGGFYAVVQHTDEMKELLGHWGIPTREVKT